MSRALAIVTAILTVLHSYVSAQAPTCLPGYEQLYNSLSQSPCTMILALAGVGACGGGAIDYPSLPLGFQYIGPLQPTNDTCECSTVFYSLLSACGFCQNRTYLAWSEYEVNCTVAYNQILIDPIPTSIVIPHYAYLDVVTSNGFNVTAAESAGGPESSPVSPQPTRSSIVTISTISSSAIATVTVTASTSTPTATSNSGAIVGGVVGGVAFIGKDTLCFFFSQILQ